MILLLGTFSFADSKGTKESGLKKEEIIQLLSEHYVPNEKIIVLLEKMDRGIEWDCYKEEYLDKIPPEFYEIKLNGEEKERYYRFPDGSFVNISVVGGEVVNDYYDVNSINTSSFSSRSMTSDSFGTLYKNHKVSRVVGATSAYFYASFYVPRYGQSIIYTNENSSNLYNSPYGEGIFGFGANAHSVKEMIRDKEYNGNAALFSLSKKYIAYIITLTILERGIR